MSIHSVSSCRGLSVNVDMKSLSLSVIDIVNFSILTSLFLSLSDAGSLDINMSSPDWWPGGVTLRPSRTQLKQH